MSYHYYRYNYLNSTKIVADYLAGCGESRNFFAYAGFSMAEMREHNNLLNQAVDFGHFEHRLLLADYLEKLNKRLGCGSKTLDNITKIRTAKCKAIVTGQQAALLTGPAFVIYKAVTAIVLAQKLEKELQIPVVPIFWIASEDHDFLEVNSCTILNPKGSLEKYNITSSIPGLPPVGKVPVSEEVMQIIEQLQIKFNNRSLLGLLAEIKNFAKESDNLADFYGKVMTRLFRNYGLVFFDPMAPEVRKLTKPLGEKVFAYYPDIIKEVDEAGIALQNSGYTPSFLREQANQFPMFYEVNGQREPVFIEENTVIIGKQKPISLTYSSFWKKFREEPAKFSPNAFLRPIMQDYLFPTLAYVAGPGEINYLAQLKGLYKLLDANMPVVFPRARITFIHDNDFLILKQNQVVFPIGAGEINNLKEKLLLSADENGLLKGIDSFHLQIGGDYKKLKELIQLAEPDLTSLVEKNYSKVNYQLEYLKEKVWQRYKKKNKKELQKLDKIANLLHPKGKEQEMVINIISLFEEFGIDLIDNLVQPGIVEHTEDHKLVVIRGD